MQCSSALHDSGSALHDSSSALHDGGGPCCSVQVVDLRLLANADVAVDEVAGAGGRGAAYLQELQTRAGQLQAQTQRVAQLQIIFKLPPSQ